MSLEQSSDAELVRLCTEGAAALAEQAFTTLYGRHRRYVLRVAMRYVSDPDVARDALQDTFMYLLRKFPPTGPGFTLTARMTTFLYPVAKNSAISAQRKVDRIAGSENADPDQLPADPIPAGADELDVVLRNLSPERREILLLRFVDDMSLNDIARVLDIPVGTVKSRVHLAIRELRGDPAVKKIHFP